MTTLKNKRIRGARDKIPGGYVVGREKGDGRVELIKIRDLVMKPVTSLRQLVENVFGLPKGGTTGQFLAKTSNTDYAVAWTTIDIPQSSRTAVSPMNVQSSAAGAFRGNKYTPDHDIEISAVAFQISPAASGVYKAIIGAVAAGVLSGTISSSATRTYANTTVRLVYFEFASPVTLTAGTEYFIACGRTDSTDTATLSICVNDNAGDDGGGLPGFFGSRAVVAKAAPAASDTVTNEAGNNFGWFVIWTPA